MQLICLNSLKDAKRLSKLWQIDGYFWVSGGLGPEINCPECGGRELYRTTYQFNRGDYNNSESHRHILECRRCGYVGVEVEGLKTCTIKPKEGVDVRKFLCSLEYEVKRVPKIDDTEESYSVVVFFCNNDLGTRTARIWIEGDVYHNSSDELLRDMAAKQYAEDIEKLMQFLERVDKA